MSGDLRTGDTRHLTEEQQDGLVQTDAIASSADETTDRAAAATAVADEPATADVAATVAPEDAPQAVDDARVAVDEARVAVDSAPDGSEPAAAVSEPAAAVADDSAGTESVATEVTPDEATPDADNGTGPKADA